MTIRFINSDEEKKIDFRWWIELIFKKYKIENFLLTYSGLSFLSLPRMHDRSSFSKFFSKASSSFRRSSSVIISKSLIGSTSPSTWVTSASSKAPAIYELLKKKWRRIPCKIVLFKRKHFKLLSLCLNAKIYRISEFVQKKKQHHQNWNITVLQAVVSSH